MSLSMVRIPHLRIYFVGKNTVKDFIEKKISVLFIIVKKLYYPKIFEVGY